MARDYITIKQQTRLAKVRLTKYYADKLGRKEEECICDVHGLFQSVDGDSACPVFVCELDDGSVVEVSVDKVTFIDDRVAILKAISKHYEEEGK